MSSGALFLATALLAGPLVHGHYIFSQLVVNDKPVGTDYTYIRKNTNTYMPSFTQDVVNSPNLICNEGAQRAASQTYDVKAGDKIGFKLWYNEFIEHPGPAFVYMSKAPGEVASYDGTDDWFKAYENGVTGSPSQDTNWGTWQKDRIEFTIPAHIPDGEYLVRPEHIALHEGHVGKVQFYMECAQLRISGGGNGTPSPLVKIPGLYSAQDPGFAFNKWGGNVGIYEMPGPAVWSGGGSGGSASTSSSGNSSTAEVSGGDSGASTSSASTPDASTSGGSTSGSSAGSTGTGGTTGTSGATGSAEPANGFSGSQAGSSGGSANTWGTTAGQAPSWGSWTAARLRRSFIA
ncbi:hypothetical protein CBER1_11673 [Cercospora berteroae]|uniref:AA9 family lytic polysaccharide monooxygenase n=1 Tax=Cercospora berteroae TaxID=357750 RepID=A0A2S6C053_9PEZI|nr:hypothetical protein CBER1_11673 [Cercospora berteroae]